MDLICQNANILIGFLHLSIIRPAIVIPKDRSLVIHLAEDREPRQLRTELCLLLPMELFLDPRDILRCRRLQTSEELSLRRQLGHRDFTFQKIDDRMG